MGARKQRQKWASSVACSSPDIRTKLSLQKIYIKNKGSCSNHLIILANHTSKILNFLIFVSHNCCELYIIVVLSSWFHLNSNYLSRISWLWFWCLLTPIPYCKIHFSIKWAINLVPNVYHSALSKLFIFLPSLNRDGRNALAHIHGSSSHGQTKTSSSNTLATANIIQCHRS